MYNPETIDSELDNISFQLERLREKALSGSALEEIAQAYERLCQLHGYLATFYPGTPQSARSFQLVCRGRRFIYRGTDETLDAPRLNLRQRIVKSFRAFRRYALVSGVMGISSALLAALLVKIQPSLAFSFLDESTLEGVLSGHLWTERVRGMSALASSGIMKNNITVSIMAFCLGLTGGVGTAVLIVANGVHLGGTFAVLAQYQMAGKLFDFVIAHGLLELSIIIVSGGAGLAIGDALIAPGNKSRLDSCRARVREVLDALVFSALALILAGIVEGYVSPYDEVPHAVKVITGIVLGLGYWSMLLFGRLIPIRMRKNV